MKGDLQMYVENIGIDGLVTDLKLMEEVMLKNGLVLEGQWDYERVTFDKKYVIREGTYYLRIFGELVEGDIDGRKATVRLKQPVLGKYYYPFGVEYGEGEEFPASLVKDCELTAKAVYDELKQYSV
ncbi:YugN-like family protein [Sporosarcina newyorkensis]|uniref:YugN-like family protein n=2 Tax=Caryophanaceae TaxID=186818 RepID=A0A1T4YGX8_9BACL|nr:YugN-like family protein [Sporosarcina newyorkensis]